MSGGLNLGDILSNLNYAMTEFTEQSISSTNQIAWPTLYRWTACQPSRLATLDRWAGEFSRPRKSQRETGELRAPIDTQNDLNNKTGCPDKGVAVIKFKVNNGGGSGFSCFEIEIRMNTAKLTNVRITRFRQCSDLVWESGCSAKSERY